MPERSAMDAEGSRFRDGLSPYPEIPTGLPPLEHRLAYVRKRASVAALIETLLEQWPDR
jgi:hypothetical protein